MATHSWKQCTRVASNGSRLQPEAALLLMTSVRQHRVPIGAGPLCHWLCFLPADFHRAGRFNKGDKRCEKFSDVVLMTVAFALQIGRVRELLFRELKLNTMMWRKMPGAMPAGVTELFVYIMKLSCP